MTRHVMINKPILFFLLFLLLLLAQGELVNQIEFNVEHATSYVEKGAKITREARNYKSSNRRVSGVLIEHLLII